MAAFTLASFGIIAITLFITELTDKDAFLLIAVSTKVKVWIALLAGVTAFSINTAVFVTLGSLLLTFVPIYWIRLAGGVVMLAYGLWEARGLIGFREVEKQENKIGRTGRRLNAFFALVGALILLDLAGDATEVLTIVYVAQYANAILVFTGACAGLFSAAAVETTLGSRLGKTLTPDRLRYFSVIVFLALGISIILLNVG